MREVCWLEPTSVDAVKITIIQINTGAHVLNLPITRMRRDLLLKRGLSLSALLNDRPGSLNGRIDHFPEHLSRANYPFVEVKVLAGLGQMSAPGLFNPFA